MPSGVHGAARGCTNSTGSALSLSPLRRGQTVWYGVIRHGRSSTVLTILLQWISSQTWTEKHWLCQLNQNASLCQSGFFNFLLVNYRFTKLTSKRNSLLTLKPLDDLCTSVPCVRTAGVVTDEGGCKRDRRGSILGFPPTHSLTLI